jgi:hypothetical protein
MGCNESREKIKVSFSSFSFTKSPLPLHIYPHVNDINPYTIKTTPKSSPTASLTTSRTVSPASSPTNTTTVATSYVSRLTSIAHFKFPTFREFPKNVQTEILHHIDKELKMQ